MERFIFNLKIATGALMQNKLRSLLTALGIIFGVASVIAMQAIGKGTEQNILEKLKLVGVNNIVISQKATDNSSQENDEKSRQTRKPNTSFGLNINDGQALKDLVPEVVQYSPLIESKVFTVYNTRGYDARLLGVFSCYFNMMGRGLETGHLFDSLQVSHALPVCILSPEARQKFFHSEPCLGRYIKCGNLWLQVIGVLNPILVDDSLKKKNNLLDNEPEIYTPAHTLLLRLNDRSFITKDRINASFNNNNDDDDDQQNRKEAAKYNQVDKLIVQVKSSDYVPAVTEVAAAMLKRRHAGIADFEIKIPEAELKQEQDTKETFNLVLGIIAGISLLVGGIGIMNIMLVSVTERTKEIGLRMALGARKQDVIQQFMAEAVMLSSGGGFIGLATGLIVSKLLSGYFHIPAIITFMSLLIAFAFSVGVGLIFGITPARRAALQNPIESLRYE